MKLKIHSWGGLGSQLHALSLTHDLIKNFPKRKLILIHHTSGVSRRLFESEIFLEKSIELRTIDDYKWEKRNHANQELYLKKYFFRLARFILNITSINVDIDDNSLNRIKFWTRDLRGHYSKLEINKGFLKLCVESFLSKDLSSMDFQDTLIIHYRLGDLLTLAQKSTIDPDIIINEVKKVSKLYNFGKIVVYSDTIDLAKQKLVGLNSICDQIIYSSAPTIEVMECATKAIFFIGTNSKVSFWIENFRNFIGKPSCIIHSS
jgi:hypothetical protein